MTGNKFTKLISESNLAVMIAGLPALNRFELFPLTDESDDAVTLAARHNLQFIGVVGLDKHFFPRSAFAVELSSDQQQYIADQFVELVERTIARVEGTDAAWLHKLHALPDMRAN
jgi:hypothetical protein